jgi:short subunit fatty acids transporter
MMLGVPGARRLMKSPHPDHRIRNSLVSELESLKIVLFFAQLKLAEQPEAVAVYGEYGVPDQGGIFVQFAVGSGRRKMMGFAADKKHKLAGRLGSRVVVIVAVNGIGR